LNDPVAINFCRWGSNERFSMPEISTPVEFIDVVNVIDDVTFTIYHRPPCRPKNSAEFRSLLESLASLLHTLARNQEGVGEMPNHGGDE
jgi:hypothetical protein